MLAGRVPNFKFFTSSSPRASKRLSKIKSFDNRGEQILRSALWRMGLRFRKHVRTLPGIPDIVFPGKRVVVFCDGDFWHGRNWLKDRQRLSGGPNAPYWIAKIEANMKRDALRNKELRKMGWFVIRVWDSDVKKDPS